MRTQFLQAGSRNAAKSAAPWAAKIAKVDGGYMAFESVADHAMWRSQR